MSGTNTNLPAALDIMSLVPWVCASHRPGRFEKEEIALRGVKRVCKDPLGDAQSTPSLPRGALLEEKRTPTGGVSCRAV